MKSQGVASLTAFIVISIIVLIIVLSLGTAFFVSLNRFLNNLGIFKWFVLAFIFLLIFKNRKRIASFFKRLI